MTENTINFFNGNSAEPANMVMRISKEGIWVDPALPTTEAADAVLRALDGSIKFMVNKAIEDEREAYAAQPEQGYTTKRNVWTGNATHKCNVCGRDDFRSEHAAKFHKCEAVEEPEPHSQDRWLDIQLPETTPPQRTWVGLTDEEMLAIVHYSQLDNAKAIEAKLKQKNGYAEEKNNE